MLVYLVRFFGAGGGTGVFTTWLSDAHALSRIDTRTAK